MDGAQDGGSSGALPPFLAKTYAMVDDPATDAVVSWSPSGTSFVVWKTAELSRDLLHRYFKHSNFASFVRQLNTYGFRKIDPEQYEFANGEFIRGKRHLLKNIHRRKPIHSHSLRPRDGSLAPLEKSERNELKEEIERLKRDKKRLIMDLQRHMQQQRGMEQHMVSIDERLQIIKCRQRNLIEFLSRMIRRPGFLSKLVEQLDFGTKKRRLTESDDSYDMEVNQIVTFQTARIEESETTYTQVLNMEPFEKMESSLNAMENFLRSASQGSGGDMYFDVSVPSSPSSRVPDMQASTGTDANLPSLSMLHSSSPCVEGIHSSPESISYVENPDISIMEIHMDRQTKAFEIDVSSEPAAPDVDSSSDPTARTTIAVPVGVNDVFWEQFLTETPVSIVTEEVQSERLNIDEKTCERNMVEQVSSWWNRMDAALLKEQTRHLTPTEKT